MKIEHIHCPNCGKSIQAEEELLNKWINQKLECEDCKWNGTLGDMPNNDEWKNINRTKTIDKMLNK